MTRRREFSRKVKAQAFERAAGRCEGCTAPLAPSQYHYDHEIPTAMGGPATLDNCQVLCKTCHGIKTAKKDVPTIAKSNRQRDKHSGAFTKRKQLIPGSKGTRFRKKLTGEVERR